MPPHPYKKQKCFSFALLYFHFLYEQGGKGLGKRKEVNIEILV